MHYPGVDSYVLLTRPLRVASVIASDRVGRVQLACVRHAASVNPEPESNSPFLRFINRGDRRWVGLFFDSLSVDDLAGFTRVFNDRLVSSCSNDR